MQRKIIFSIILAGGLSACSLIPPYMRPSMNTPAEWSSAASVKTVPLVKEWWNYFGSAELNRLMGQALNDNLDLRAALGRVAQARAQEKIARASLFPSLDASGSITASRDNPARGAATGGTGYAANLGLSYEADLWGANAADRKAASARTLSSIFDRDALALLVAGDVSQAYFDVLTFRERLFISQNNLANAKEILNIVEARFTIGAASALELAQQKTAVANAEAAYASLERQEKNAENRLAILLGEAPQKIKVLAKNLDKLMVPSVAPLQPAQLLERRPDIRAAEAGLIAANADIGAARAAYYPSLNLSADAGLAARTLGSPIGTALSAAGSLTAPIFQGGALEGGVELSLARRNELAEIYRKTVLTAFQEVEDALIAAVTAEKRAIALQTAAQEAANAYRLSRLRYEAGSIDFLTLLDAQRSQ
ncbi:MAG: efflux transporter outer membrane subunit, partial [Dongiaceae bacterium]